MIVRKFTSVQINSLGDRDADFCVSTGKIDDAGDCVVQEGIQIRPYVKNPVVFWNHDPSTVIGNASNVRLGPDGNLHARITFLPVGMSAKSDEACGMVKIGAVKSASIGFSVISKTPLDPSKPRGGMKYEKTVLLEISVVSLPANCDAVCINKTAATERTREQRMRRARAIALVGSIDDPVPVAPHIRTQEARIRRARALAIAAGYDPADPRLPSITGKARPS